MRRRLRRCVWWTIISLRFRSPTKAHSSASSTTIATTSCRRSYTSVTGGSLANRIRSRYIRRYDRRMCRVRCLIWPC
uniref:Putative secreted protein n=1 Tax=Anopheles darlingi TaxID=43151 RepID=A0A2M4DIE6_ANODA